MTIDTMANSRRPDGNFWVLDTESDGSIGQSHYNRKATSLLLNQITINEHNEDLVYIITPDGRLCNKRESIN